MEPISYQTPRAAREGDLSATIKTLIVDGLAVLPTYRSQSVAAAIVRTVWRGFARA